MRLFTFANLAKGAAAASIACCVTLPVRAHASQMRLAAEQLNQQLFEQKLQDTRTDIRKQQTTTRPTNKTGSNQLVVDICKKNPRLPQCKLK